MFAPQQIEDSLAREGIAVEKAFAGSGKYPRWGLYALLLDAELGDTILPMYLDFRSSESSPHWPLAPAPYGEWRITGDGCDLRFTNAVLGSWSLADFVVGIEDTAANITWPQWRSSTLRLHWYKLGRATHPNSYYSDFTDKTEVPDVIVTGLGSPDLGILGTLGIQLPRDLDIGISGGVSKTRDRYGNLYYSVTGGLGVGVGLGIESWEGYSHHPGTVDPLMVLDEGDLKALILGTVTAVSVYAGGGYGIEVGPYGNMIYFGTVGGIGIGGTFDITWEADKNVTPWDWIDKIPGYDASVLDATQDQH